MFFNMKRESTQLIDLLNKAAQEMLERGDVPYLGEYGSCNELGKFFTTAAEELRLGNESHANKLWGIFAPTCDWDDAGGTASLGDSVFALLNVLYRPTQF